MQQMKRTQAVRCPVCGREYLISEFVVDELNAAEQMLEGK